MSKITVVYYDTENCPKHDDLYKICKQFKEISGQNVIAMPDNLNVFQDMPIDMLIEYRDRISTLIDSMIGKTEYIPQ